MKIAILLLDLCQVRLNKSNTGPMSMLQPISQRLDIRGQNVDSESGRHLGLRVEDPLKDEIPKR